MYRVKIARERTVPVWRIHGLHHLTPLTPSFLFRCRISVHPKWKDVPVRHIYPICIFATSPPRPKQEKRKITADVRTVTVAR